MMMWPLSWSMSLCMRRTPKNAWNWLTVMSWIRLPVRKIMPVQPVTMSVIVMARNAVVSIGRTSSNPTV